MPYLVNFDSPICRDTLASYLLIDILEVKTDNFLGLKMRFKPSARCVTNEIVILNGGRLSWLFIQAIYFVKERYFSFIWCLENMGIFFQFLRFNGYSAMLRFRVTHH